MHQVRRLTHLARAREAKMRTLLLALCIGLPLSACQTSPQEPPPTFSPGVQAYFEKYMS